jgi:NAD(P)-dependent dehydrogenase (short-subunit alcohol dehydrogenase family)
MTALNRTAVVTGAGTGIGKAVAHALLHEGYAVVFAGRRMQLLEDAIAEAGTAGDRAPAAAADIADPASVESLFRHTQARFGRLDLLFNNAGVGAPSAALEDLSFEDFKRVIDINLTGVFLCSQQAIRIMKAQTPRGGRIINNGSISAHAPRPNSVAYTATKHAVTGLTKAMALDCRKYEIACGQIDIGNADTSMAANMKTGMPQANGTIAIEPTMDVSNVAKAVVYMDSLPLDANVLFLTIMATNMPYVGRG